MIITSRLLLAFLSASAFLGLACAKRVEKRAAQDEKDDVACVRKTDLRLIAAVMKNDVDAMKAALESGANVSATAEGLGPPIVIASLGGDAAVELLLNNGANPNAPDAEGYTALVNASLWGYRDMVRLLISRGADVNAPAYLKLARGGTAKFTPLMIAKTKGHEDIVKLLTDAGAKE